MKSKSKSKRRAARDNKRQQKRQQRTARDSKRQQKTARARKENKSKTENCGLEWTRVRRKIARGVHYYDVRHTSCFSHTIPSK